MAVRSIPFYALGTLSVVGVSVGRMTCGILCPFGALQDLLYKLRTWKISIPPEARFLRYAVLALLVFAIPFLTGEHWFSKLCPAGTLEAGLPWAIMDADVRRLIGSMFWVKTALLLLFVSLSAVAKRPFCRTTCPLGAILSLFNRASFVQLAWNSDSCTRCGKCRNICPVDIRPDRKPADPECLRCLDCTKCPSLKVTTLFHERPFATAGVAETTTMPEESR
ncbi:MAG: 4Fe-4S binding protein [Syntrophorhabdaceae bacterium]|nr:4Fe-4S binding protein [Syntrophorhabdaceae bacterium]